MYTKFITVEIDSEEIDVEVSFSILKGEEATYWEPGYPPEITDFFIENIKDLTKYNLPTLCDLVGDYIQENESEIIGEYKQFYEEEAAEYKYEQMMDRL